MATNDITSNVVGIAAVQTAYPPSAPALAGSDGGAASQSQTQLWSPGTGSSSGGSAGGPQNNTQEQIDNALKNTGVKAEFDNEQGIGMVVRLVDASSGQLLMQLPPQAVLDLVEQVTSQIDMEMSQQFGSPNYSGTNIDQVA